MIPRWSPAEGGRGSIDKASNLPMHLTASSLSSIDDCDNELCTQSGIGMDLIELQGGRIVLVCIAFVKKNVIKSGWQDCACLQCICEKNVIKSGWQDWKSETRSICDNFSHSYWQSWRAMHTKVCSNGNISFNREKERQSAIHLLKNCIENCDKQCTSFSSVLFQN